MTDFLTRVAGRAIGLRPAIQPLVVSRYAPARLPISEESESPPVSLLGAEASRTNPASGAPVRSASSVSRPDRLPSPPAMTDPSPQDRSLSYDGNSLSESSESIAPTSLGNEIRPRRTFTEFEEVASFTVATPSTDAAADVDAAPAGDANAIPTADAGINAAATLNADLTLNADVTLNADASPHAGVSPHSHVSPNVDLSPNTNTAADTEAEAASTMPSSGAAASLLFESNISAGHSPTPQLKSTVKPASLPGSGETLTGLSPGDSVHPGLAEITGEDEVWPNVESTGEPSRWALSDQVLEKSFGVSTPAESSIADAGLVKVEDSDQARHREVVDGPTSPHATADSPSADSLIDDEVQLDVEKNGERSRRLLMASIRQMADQPPDDVAWDGLHDAEPNGPSARAPRQPQQIPETSHRQERNTHASEDKDQTPEAELRTLAPPERRNREINSAESFPEMFPQKRASPVPLPIDDWVESKPPRIRVTIGRVEVRAVTPPAPVGEPPPRAPKLSLDEFLRQHNGRRQ